MTSKPKILCIEDEPILLEDLADELRDEGFEVLEALDGQAGFDLIKSEEPDLVLCDMMMPRMNGEQVLEAVRALPTKTADTAFVFLTAKATREDIIEGKSLGADDYLTKPVDYGLLLATIKVRLDQVERIKKRQEEHLVRIYQALSKETPVPKNNSGDALIGIISTDFTPLGGLNKGLAAMGCRVSVIHTVDALPSAANASGLPDIVFVHEDEQTNAGTAEKVRKIVNRESLPVYLLGSYKKTKSADVYASFDKIIPHPYKPQDVLQAILASYQGIARPAA